MKADAIAREYSEKLRSALGSRVRDIILFGSRARGDNEYYSDYDMLVVVDRCDREIVKKIREIAVEMLDHHEPLFGNIVYDAQEWERKKRFPLGMSIQREGIII
jgi:predicted nucleotidyltransferase